MIKLSSHLALVTGVHLISRELFWIFLIDVVEAFADFDRNTCERLPDFNAFNSACEEDAENILPALPVLWVFLGHGLKAVEQDFKEFCVGSVGMLLEDLGELFGFLKVSFWSIVVILDADLIACDRDISCVEVSDAIYVESRLIFGLIRHGRLVEELFSYWVMMLMIVAASMSVRSDLE